MAVSNGAFRTGLVTAAALVALASRLPGQTGLPSAASQETGVPFELWGNVILDFPKGDRWLFETDFEPKTLVSGGEKWWNLDFTPHTEFYPSRWIDLIGETNIGYTHQPDQVDTVEVTPRIGFRINLLNNLREKANLPFRPLERIRMATLVRVEYRNFWYSDDEPTQHEWRIRVRLESKIGINRADFSQDNSLYGIADGEWFIPLTGDVSERFASKARARFGFGYRMRYATRFEVLYIRNWNRATEEGPKEPTSNAVDLRLKLYF